MAYTKLEDVIVKDLWTPDFIEDAPIFRSILESGLVTRSARLDRTVNAADAGQIITIPTGIEPTYEEPEVIDDSETEIAESKVVFKPQNAFLGLYAKAWAEAQIIDVLSTNDPVRFLRDNYIAKYWAKDTIARIGHTLSGVVAKDISNGMTFGIDVSSGDSANPQTLKPEHVIDAEAKIGAGIDTIEYMFVHPKVYGDLRKDNLVQTVKPSEGAEPIDMYAGRRLFVSDAVPVADVNGEKKYVTILAREGLIAYSSKRLSDADGMAPIAIVRDEKAGRGGGKRTLISRRGVVIHPFGFTFTANNITSVSPKLSELADGNNWDVVFQPQSLGIAYVISN